MKNLFSHIVLICSLVYTFFVFSGYNIGWGHFPYDEWRLLANSLLVIIVCIALKPEIWICNVVIVRLIGPLVILFIIVIIYILFIPKQINSISFLLVYSLLYFAIFIYSFVFQINRSKEFYLIILSCMPLLTVMWLPIESILMYMFPEEIASKAWLGNFLNKRQYDDAILPFLFILALLKVPKNFEIFRWALWVLILSGSIQNGSRAVIFSLIFGLIFAAIWYRSYRWSRIFIIGTISAVLLALVFTFLQNQPALTALQRIDDSGRGHIYFQAWQLGQSNWLFGSFDKINYTFVFHPHNIFLQWWTEYGVLGIYLAIISIVFVLAILKQSCVLPPLSVAGIISISVNAMLSGAMVYPHSQIFNMIYFAYVVSLLPQIEKPLFWEKQRKYIVGLVIVLVGLLLFYQHSNFLIWNGTSELYQSSGSHDSIVAPYWWQYGGSEWLGNMNE